MRCRGDRPLLAGRGQLFTEHDLVLADAADQLIAFDLPLETEGAVPGGAALFRRDNADEILFDAALDGVVAGAGAAVIGRRTCHLAVFNLGDGQGHADVVIALVRVDGEAAFVRPDIESCA